MNQTKPKLMTRLNNCNAVLPIGITARNKISYVVDTVANHGSGKSTCNKIVATSFMLLLLLVLSFSTFASHVSGGQIYYTSLGGNNYLISLSIYRDCSGISPASSYSLPIALGANTPVVYIANLVSTTDISVTCPGQPSTCTGGSLPGMQEWLYQVTVNLPPSGGQVYTISWSECCRSGSISNLVSPSSYGIYLETKLDPNLAVLNNSPKFLQQPPAYFCLGLSGSYSPMGFDTDGDSIAYSLVNPRNDALTNLAYVSGLSATTPLFSSTPVTIDPLTGLISFTPSSLQTAVIAVRMKEYRNQTLISEIDREFVVYIIDCGTNIPPVITPVANVTLVEGQLFNQAIVATDANVTQNISATAISGCMPPATFVVNSAVPGTTNATFSFTPTSIHKGRTFSVAVTATDDNNCPPISTMTIFKIKVEGGIFTTGGVGTSHCPGAVISVPYTSSEVIFGPGNVFTAQLSDATGSFSIPVDIGSISSTSPNGNIPAIIPANTLSGSNYLVRVVSSDPIQTAASNGYFISILASPVLTASATPSTVGPATSFQLSVSPVPISVASYTVNPISYAPVTSGITTSVSLSDDQVSGAIPVGFNFPFFTNTYSTVYISSNGFLSFDAGAGSGCCSGEVIPTNTNPTLNNLIALSWTDLYPVLPSSIDYFNLTSPNRFVVRYNGVFRCCGSTVQTTAQVILYEDGTIEMHNTDIVAIGTMTQGVENSTGTIATTVPGRNGSTWAATNDAYRFTPLNNPPGYSWLPVLNMNNSLSYNPTVSSIAATTVYTVTYTNPAGCSSTATTQVNMVGVNCPGNQAASASGNCNAVVTYTTTVGGSPAPVVSYVFSGVTTGSGAGDGSGSTFNIGTTTVTLTATNIDGTNTCSFDVVVSDNTSPTITCAANTTVNTNGSCEATAGDYTVGSSFNLSVTVNSGSSGTTCTDGFLGGAPDLQWDVKIGGQAYFTYPQSGICFNNTPNLQYSQVYTLGNYPATLEVCFSAYEDDGTTCIVSKSCNVELCQNFATPAPGTSATYSITIPNSGNASYGTVSFTLTASALPSVATDICSAVTVVQSPPAGTLLSVGNHTITLTATDAAANTAVCSFVLTVAEVEAPVITCPSGITVAAPSGACSTIVNYAQPTITDNCNSPSVITFSKQFINGETSLDCGSWLTFKSELLGTYAYTKATIKGSFDPIGVSLTDPAKVLQLANSLRTNVSVSIPDGPNIWATNFCGGFMELSTNGTTCQCSNPAYIIRPCLANPNWGGAGTTTCNAPSQIITVEFEIANNNATLTQTAGLPSGAAFPVGTTVNIFRATDASGNTAECSQTVVVIDNQAPTINCLVNITTCNSNVTYATTGADNCGLPAITFLPPSGSNFPIGTTTVTAKATDASGNTATCTFTVTVNASMVINVTKMNVRCGVNCTGSINITPTGGITPYTYAWADGPVNAVRNNLCVGNYTCTITDATGCTKSKTIVITGNPLLNATVFPMPTTLATTAGGGVPPYTYLWNTVPAQTTATATGLLPTTTYKVKVTDSKNCTKVVLATTTSNIKLSADNGSLITVHPNPTNGVVRLSVINCLNCETNIILYDLIGNIVYSNKLKVENNTTLDFSFLAKGIYTMKVMYDGRSEMVKLMIQ